MPPRLNPPPHSFYGNGQYLPNLINMKTSDIGGNKIPQMIHHLDHFLYHASYQKVYCMKYYSKHLRANVGQCIFLCAQDRVASFSHIEVQCTSSVSEEQQSTTLHMDFLKMMMIRGVNNSSVPNCALRCTGNALHLHLG